MDGFIRFLDGFGWVFGRVYQSNGRVGRVLTNIAYSKKLLSVVMHHNFYYIEQLDPKPVQIPNYSGKPVQNPSKNPSK